jgi:twitching motility protein PilT
MTPHVPEEVLGHLGIVEPSLGNDRDLDCLLDCCGEVHEHTESFAKALRAALREMPDIVLVGEMRDFETAKIGVEASLTGHLVFSTLHTTSAAGTITRIIDVFPVDQQEQIRIQLSSNLIAVLSQELCPLATGKGRVAAYEFMVVRRPLRT